MDSLLQARGHRVALSVGGPGLPDVISLDASGRLWISEVKGTTISGKLPASGLKRTLATGSHANAPYTMFENAPEWLLRHTSGIGRVEQVLGAIDKAIESTAEAGHKLQLRELRERYRDAARQGFSPLICDKQLVQVGFQNANDNLAPPSWFRSELLDEYIHEVEPAKIVQVEVVLGSAQSEVFDQPSQITIAKSTQSEDQKP